MTPLISVPIPTVAGREALLERAIRSYEETANVEILVARGENMTCGLGWTEGADRAKGDYIAFGADDVEMQPGWAEAAISCVEDGFLPAAVIYNTDGSLQACGYAHGYWVEDGSPCEMSRSPFIKREWWEFVGPIPSDLHYYTDDWVTWRCRQQGIEPRVCYGFMYTHHMAQPGRAEHRMGADGGRFHAYQAAA